MVGIQQYLVKPNVANSSDNFLSSEVLMEAPSITEELVKKSLPLEYVILQVSNFFFAFYLLKKILTLAVIISIIKKKMAASHTVNFFFSPSRKQDLP